MNNGLLLLLGCCYPRRDPRVLIVSGVALLYISTMSNEEEETINDGLEHSLACAPSEIFRKRHTRVPMVIDKLYSQKLYETFFVEI